MLFDWLGDLLECKAESSPRLRRNRLRLEALESRVVPAAIRSLPGFTANTLAPNDDGSTPAAVPVGFSMNYFGLLANSVFVNNNGNITFGQAFGTYTPTALNTDNGGVPIIAAFFADVDTRGAGSGVVQYGTDILCGRPAFGVNSINVGYFDSHTDLLNSFQLILVDRSDTGAGNFDIEFNYDRILWETGDASGGVNGTGGESAHVGYTNGTGQAGTFFELNGSGINGALLDGGPNGLVGTMQFSSTPGRLHFLVRNGQVITGVGAMANLDVTSGTRVMGPFRYITDTATGLQRGQLTLVNVNPTSQATSVDACLDITASNSATLDAVFPAPITVVFTNLPPDIQVINPTGFTAAGRPFIQISDPLTRDRPPVRVAFQIRNANFDAPGTYFNPLQVSVFSGQFDSTVL